MHLLPRFASLLNAGTQKVVWELCAECWSDLHYYFVPEQLRELLVSQTALIFVERPSLVLHFKIGLLNFPNSSQMAENCVLGKCLIFPFSGEINEKRREERPLILSESFNQKMVLIQRLANSV